MNVGNYQDLERAVRLLGGGENRVIYDEAGLPSVMVRLEKKSVCDLIGGGDRRTHPAFIVNGVEVDAIWVSKYQNCLVNDRAYSLPLQDPATSISFDEARLRCEAKGRGWHLMTAAEWAAVALSCAVAPRGNNLFGQDHGSHVVDELDEIVPPSPLLPMWERGLLVAPEDESMKRVATGSGPATWSHDGTPGGIWDVNGNVDEWLGGFRIVDGEVQVLPDNDAASGVAQNPESTRWKGVLADGKLADRGTPNTLKWDYTAANPGKDAAFRLCNVLENATPDASGKVAFEDLAASCAVPDLLKSLALMPVGAGRCDAVKMVQSGERMLCRGGSWSDGMDAGVFAANMCHDRKTEAENIGFRAVYIEGI